MAAGNVMREAPYQAAPAQPPAAAAPAARPATQPVVFVSEGPLAPVWLGTP